MQIYFIKESAEGNIKIGVSRNVHARMQSLQRQIPQSLECLGVIKGNFIKEKSLHKRFKHLNVRGEWFSPDEELLSFIKEKSKPFVPPPKIRKKNKFPDNRIKLIC